MRIKQLCSFVLTVGVLLFSSAAFSLSPEDDPEITRLRAAADQGQAALHRARETADARKAAFERADQEFKAINAKMASLSNERKAVVDRIPGLQREIAAHQQNAQQLKTQAEQAGRSGNGSMAASLAARAQQEVAAAKTKIAACEQLKSKADALGRELATNDSTYKAKRQVAEQAKAAFDQAVSQFNTVKATFERAVATYKNARDSLAQEMNRANAAGVDSGKREGIAQGQAAGIRDGRQSGGIDGERQGRLDGTAIGRERAFERGANQGKLAGTKEGMENGTRDGEQKGEIEGRGKGSYEAGYSEGYPDGERDGLNSDATTRGNNDGKAAGTADGERVGREDGYPNGYQDVTEKYEGAKLKEVALDQAVQPEAGSGPQSSSALFSTFKLMSDAPGCNHGRQVLRLACNEGFNAAYGREKQAAYNHFHKQAYDQSRQAAYNDAKNRAASAAYPEQEQEGFKTARAEAYRVEYKTAYDRAYERSFEQHRRLAREHKGERDQANFDKGQQDGHEQGFAAGAKKAYDTAYQAAYDAARKTAYDRAFAEAKRRGQAEAEAFYRANAVLVVERVVLVDGNRNDVFQPGETFDLRLRIKNTGLASQKSGLVLKLRVEDQPPQSTLTRNTIELAQIPPQSAVTLTLKGAGRSLAEELQNNQVVASNLRLDLLQGDKKILAKALQYNISWTYVFSTAQFLDELLVNQKARLSLVVQNAGKTDGSAALKLVATPRADFFSFDELEKPVGPLKAGESVKRGYTMHVAATGMFKTGTVDITVQDGDQRGGIVRMSGNVTTRYKHDPHSHLLLVVKGGEANRALLSNLARANLQADIYDLGIEEPLDAQTLKAYKNRMVVISMAGKEGAELTERAKVYAEYVAAGGRLLVGGVTPAALINDAPAFASLLRAVPWNKDQGDANRGKDFPYVYTDKIAGAPAFKVISGNFHREGAFRYRMLFLKDPVTSLSADQQAQVLLASRLWLLPFEEKLAFFGSTMLANNPNARTIARRAIVADVVEEIAYTEAIKGNPYTGAVAEATLVHAFTEQLLRLGTANRDYVSDIREMFEDVNEFRDKHASGGIFRSKKRDIWNIIKKLQVLW